MGCRLRVSVFPVDLGVRGCSIHGTSTGEEPLQRIVDKNIPLAVLNGGIIRGNFLYIFPFPVHAHIDIAK